MAMILIIDDDEIIRHFINLVLTKNGYEVLEAKDGNIGLEVFNSEKVDLVITDIIMEYSGLDVIKNLNARKNRVPIIGITGSLLSATTLQEEYKVSYILVKPFDKKKLLDAVTKFIPV